MKLTLLEIVQDMLVATDSENVSDVGETEDAGMCVNIANREFEMLISKYRWRHTRSFERLVIGSNNHEMGLPTNAVAITPHTVHYKGQRVYYMPPDDFLVFTIARDTTASNVAEVNQIKVYTDRDPQYYTSFDDETLIFDSYDTTSLVSANSDAIVYLQPTSRLTANGEYFDLPAQAFSALSQRCIARAVLEIKGDTQGYNSEKRSADNAIAALSRNARLVDIPDDRRGHIIPRRTRRDSFVTRNRNLP
jgi:hypothetical protein